MIHDQNLTMEILLQHCHEIDFNARCIEVAMLVNKDSELTRHKVLLHNIEDCIKAATIQLDRLLK